MISEVILQHAELNPEKIAICAGESTCTYKEILDKVEQYSVSLAACGKYLIDSSSPIDAVCQLLACQLNQSVGLIVHPDIPALEKQHLIDKEGFISFGDTDAKRSANQSDFIAILTSGSTGSPKLIYKDNECWEKAFIHQSEVFGISSVDNILVVDALAYSANLNAVLHGLWLGATVTLCSLNKARYWGQLIEQKEVTSIFMVPSHLNLLLATPSNGSINSIVTAGEKLSTKHASQIINKYPGVLLTEYYGTAELGHITYHQNNDILANPISVGTIFPEVSIEIKENQIHVKSPYISPAYRNINTVGDLGILENEKLILLGRSGRMFNRRGLNIYAQEIEQKALANTFVNVARLIEVRRNGVNKLTLYFSSVDKFDLSQNRANELMKYLRAILPVAKCPNRVIEVESIPKLINGKIDEKGLKLMSEYVEEEELTN